MSTSYKRGRRIKKAYHLTWFILYDFLAAGLAWVLFYYVRKYLLGESLQSPVHIPIISSMIIGVFWLVMYSMAGFYVDIYRKSRIKEFLILLLVTFIGSIVLFFVLFLDDSGVVTQSGLQYKSYYKTFGSYFGIHFLAAATFKMSVLSYMKKLIKQGRLTFNTLIIGSNQKASEIYDELQKINRSLGLRFVGYLHVYPETKDLLKHQTLHHFGDIENVAKVIRRCRVEQVIIAVESSEHQRITEIMTLVSPFQVRVSIIPDVYHMLIGSVKVNHVLGVPLIEVNQQLMPIWQRVIKRAFDIGFSLFVLTVGSPVLIGFALMTKFSSPGPIIYSQIRIGKDEKPFAIHKFRSMYVNSESAGPALSSDSDPRVTPWGRVMRKTRIDEFPQFFNVLIGNMSIVGPRPERKFFIDQIVKEAPHQRNLLRVKPGITSLGQVKYGYAENVEQMVKRLKFDILYLENMSLAMDFRILLFTILIVIQGRGK